MRLSLFILENRETILAEWESFSRTLLPAAEGMSIEGLRDHASEILTAIAADMSTVQTASEQQTKSKGWAVQAQGAPDTAAHQHGTARASGGFTVEQMISEYRALRASVLRLWFAAAAGEASTDVEDIVRFNEAIDQAIAEAIDRFRHEMDRSRDLFLAILSHDLRTPLGAIIMAANVLLRTAGNRAQDAGMASKILNSGARMAQIISDLLVFSRTRLGNKLPVQLGEVNLSQVVEGVVDELHTLYPGRDISVLEQGNLSGRWDGSRLAQMICNLLTNALLYGAANGVIKLSLRETGGEVEVSVHNVGDPIDPSRLQRVFDPLVRGPSSSGTASSPDGLGLGLYIVRAIAEAHGGSASVKSSLAEGTTFTVRLPKQGGGEVPA